MVKFPAVIRSILQKKALVLVLAVLALAALTVLATGLEQIPFREGQQFSQAESRQTGGASVQDVINIWMSIPLWKQIALWILLSILVILTGLLMSPEQRKQLFLFFIRTTLTMIGLYYLMKNYGANFFAALNVQGEAFTDPANPVDVAPAPVFEPPAPSSTTSYLISFAFALAFVIAAYLVYRAWKKYSDANRSPLKELAHIARSSLRDISSGRESSDVIINCYLRMADIVADKRQLQREDAMTPQEFAMRLERAGLPGDAVRRLTRLFETVRYGDRKSGPKEVNEAVSCLNTILQYCGEAI